ncbi:MAG: protein kinase, partial [Gammaproteobacteria bacterium]|nr:protein kinase [Gammaproteobacteria bacterium]
MKEFERLLTAYRGGKVDLESLQASVESLVGESNGAATEALMLLEAARAGGLSEPAYTALRRRLIALSGKSATRLSVPPGAGVDDSTTAIHRGLGKPEGPTELNPAAGYSLDEIARRHVTIEGVPEQPPPPADERPGAAITNAGAGGTGEEPTGTLWPGLYNDTDAGVPEREFQTGEVLRGRFKLISKLGEGGMGAVWKGKDLLKEEAKDRNPYVAIKLLQADFKRHPEAFIALQRETSKQQRLAHPNIATVYDFDRDERTQTVFMTMEVMEGQPMDAFIRALPADGLPADEAMSIIEQLAAGLAYAHDNGLVHSD